MKLKTLALMAASAIGFSANALDLTGLNYIDTNSIAYPTLFSNEYFSNRFGEVYEIKGQKLELLYELNDSILININGEKAVGYVHDTQHIGGNYFLCEINECNNLLKRKYVSNIDYYDTEAEPLLRANHNLISGYGYNLIVGRISSGSSVYNVSVVDDDGILLDSFIVNSFDFTWNSSTTRYLTATTGITKEPDFKLLTASHGEYEMSLKRWDISENKFENIPLHLYDGQEINSVYPLGLAPISIGDPQINDNGEIVYPVVISAMKDNILSNKILWGKIKIEENKAFFIGPISSEDLSLSVAFGGLSSLNPVFNYDGTFTIKDKRINFDDNMLSDINIIDGDKEFINRIYNTSPNGGIIINEIGVSNRIYFPSDFNLIASNINIDPYVDPEFDIKIFSNSFNYYGIEANCTLQTTNAIVNSNEYTSLSEEALQIPIDWDSLTGEWKGAQSLIGLESISGPKEFAKFDLTADVTTGTWSMNCSGIASDIEGNKIMLNPAEITINLDDKIHGGENVISGQISIPNTQDYSGVVVTITLNGRQIEVITQEDGTFEFDRLVVGDYKVHVYSDQYVAACTDLTLSADNTNPVLSIPMYAGDINNDGGVDIGDFSLLSSLFGLNSDDENFNPLADLNHDNVINVQDLSILGSHFGTDHCEVSPQ